VPAVAAVTDTVTVHWPPFLAIVAPLNPSELPPLAPLTVPPQDPDGPVGLDAFLSPDG
jgi:hypothetical protein